MLGVPDLGRASFMRCAFCEKEKALRRLFSCGRLFGNGLARVPVGLSAGFRMAKRISSQTLVPWGPGFSIVAGSELETAHDRPPQPAGLAGRFAFFLPGSCRRAGGGLA
ncbi:MAG TPA: hypothetical protein DEH65_12725 [Delftia acidovorans]|nr:hypothetical protein [Delftia sp.]HBY35822.1 hypothetical protein [Delftia acidovorans]